MGYGDFKLMAIFGALLGWQQLPLIILLSSVVGAVIGEVTSGAVGEVAGEVTGACTWCYVRHDGR
jgi:hypothetical protein